MMYCHYLLPFFVSIYIRSSFTLNSPSLLIFTCVVCHSLVAESRCEEVTSVEKTNGIAKFFISVTQWYFSSYSPFAFFFSLYSSTGILGYFKYCPKIALKSFPVFRLK